jgi:N-acetyl-anhydromuramyl-L-alanine amidase AmpD
MRVPFIPYVQGRNAYNDGDDTKYALAFHNTSNDASDTAEAAYAKRRTDGVSSHFYGDEDSFTQSIDTADKVGHAGSSQGNENAICFELTGANGWTRAQWLAKINWALLGRVAAAVIRAHWPDGSFQVRRASVAEMKANPKIKAMYGHDDMRRAWGGTTHTDPGPNFPWDHLETVIKAALGEDDDMADYTEQQMKAFTWQYNGRGIGENNGTTVTKSTLAYFDEVLKTVRLIAQQVNIDPAELVAIQEAAERGAAEALADSVDEIVAGVVAGIKDELAGLDLDGPTLQAIQGACEQAMRNVLLHGAAPEATS